MLHAIYFVPIWETNKVIMHSNIKITMHLKKSNITKNCLPKMALWVIIWDSWGSAYGIFMFCSTKCIYLLLLLIFFLFQIKTCGFHLKEEGKELLGMLMAALANNNGYYVLYLFPLFFSKIVNCYSHKSKINWH